MEITEKKPKRKFTKKQLRASQGLLTMQAKTNIYSSQSGMTCFGAIRHVSDIRADNSCPEGQGEIIMPAKTNIYASQKGMKCFGAVRHGPDIRSDNASLEGLSTLSLQTGTNQFASQKGMRGFGSVRHGPDIRVKELYEEGPDDEYPPDEDDEPMQFKPRKIRDELPDVREHGHRRPEPSDEITHPKREPEAKSVVEPETIPKQTEEAGSDDLEEIHDVDREQSADDGLITDRNDETMDTNDNGNGQTDE